MWGAFYSYYIYGFQDMIFCKDNIIDEEEIEGLGLEIFTEDIVRLYAGDIVYGIQIKPGIEVKDAEIKLVENSIKKLQKKYNMGKLKKGYFVGIKGYYKIIHKLYDLNENYSENDDKKED